MTVRHWGREAVDMMVSVHPGAEEELRGRWRLRELRYGSKEPAASEDHLLCVLVPNPIFEEWGSKI